MNGLYNWEKQRDLLVRISEFVARASGLQEKVAKEGVTQVLQSIDGKSILINAIDLEDVLFRSDADGQDFIQVNFQAGQKILITDSLIGFRPAVLRGLDMSRLPKVVTTPDILSIFEAIQDILHSSDQDIQEITLLRRVFDSVVSGGEAIGFDLSKEREWIGRIPSAVMKVSA